MIALSSKETQKRRCIVCRKSDDKCRLIRLVCDAEGKVLLDGEYKLPGRGAYLHAEVQCLLKALKPRGSLWQRAFRREKIEPGSVKAVLEEIRKTIS